MTTNSPYAGFWKRFAAFIIDFIILWVFVSIIRAFCEPVIMERLIRHVYQTATLPLAAISTYVTVFLLLLGLYFALWESSSKQATWGKQIMKIKVVDSQGQRLSFYRAMIRTFGKVLSILPFYMGFVMAGPSQKKQALHDKIANTYVVGKEYTPTTPLPLLPKHMGCMFSLCITGGLFILFLLMIILSGKIHFSRNTGNPEQDFRQALNQLYRLHMITQGNQIQRNSKGVSIRVGVASKYGLFQTGDYLFIRDNKQACMMLVGHPELAFRVIDNTNQICCEPRQPDACGVVRGLSICPKE